MKVLWLCNYMLPMIAKKENLEATNKEGWLTGAMNQFLQEEECDITLGVCFPIPVASKILRGSLKPGFSYYSFYEDHLQPDRYDKEMEPQLKNILEDFKPDLVHIHGTEFPHALGMMKMFPYPEKILVSMQGLCEEYAKVYTKGLPAGIVNRYTLRDLLKRDNIKKQAEKFCQRGIQERKMIQSVGHVAGRTDFDREAAHNMNPKASYHFMNETLREEFYSYGQGKPEWSLDYCQRDTLFVSQGDYPIKGLHFMIEGLAILKEKFPRIHLYVAGNKITNYTTWKEKIKIGSYGRYILELIRKYELQENITFLGKQSSQQMRDKMLQCHVFVSPSVIENSPNSVGEAMIMGVPVVSARVGGIPSLLEDDKEGLFYEVDQPGSLAAKITRILTDDELARRLSAGASQRAGITHDPLVNFQRMKEVYKEIIHV